MYLCTVLRHKDLSSMAISRGANGSYEEDPELTVQLHRTLADFEANLAGEEAVYGGLTPYNLKPNADVCNIFKIQTKEINVSKCCFKTT